MAKSSKRLRIAIGGLILILIAAYFALTTIAYREWAYICVNTGSRKGYTEWLTGKRTKEWYWESPLEAFIKAKHADILKHDWVSYAGTGKNIFGMTGLFGHGRPGPIYDLPQRNFEAWIEGMDAEEKLNVYKVLSSGDRDRISALIGDAFDKVFAKP